MNDTVTKTARQELQELLALKAEGGMVDVKFYLKNLKEATPDHVYQDVLSLYNALEKGQSTELRFRDSYRTS